MAAIKEAKKALVVDFTKIETTDLAGHQLKFDVSKSLGNYIYQTTGDLGMFELAQKIYKEGKAEINDEIKGGLIAVLKGPQCPFVALVKTKLIEMLSKS
jgi:hypothetical protein